MEISRFTRLLAVLGTRPSGGVVRRRWRRSSRGWNRDWEDLGDGLGVLLDRSKARFPFRRVGFWLRSDLVDVHCLFLDLALSSMLGSQTPPPPQQYFALMAFREVLIYSGRLWCSLLLILFFFFLLLARRAMVSELGSSNGVYGFAHLARVRVPAAGESTMRTAPSRRHVAAITAVATLAVFVLLNFFSGVQPYIEPDPVFPLF